jgi:hypothetical protein
MALLPEGSYLRESAPVDLGDGLRHTVAVILERPRFVPADCTTKEGRRVGHRDEGGVVIVLAGETALEDRRAIDRLVGAKMEGRDAVRLLDFSGRKAESGLAGTSIRVRVHKVDGVFKLSADPLTQ